MSATEFDPSAFGARGDGLTDDTAALQAALDQAAEAGAGVTLGNRTYAVQGVRLRPGAAGIRGPGTLRGLGEQPVLEAAGEPGRPFEGLRLAGVAVETGPSRTGLALRGLRDARIEDCHIFGLRDLATGLDLAAPAERVTIIGCRIEAAREPLRSLVGLCVRAELPDPYAGYFTDPNGAIKVLPAATRAILLEGNRIEGGTHGIAVAGAADVTILRNTISDNSHRNINLCPAAGPCRVSDNTLLEAGSSGVALGYGTHDILVSGNRIRSRSTRPGCDRDAIHAYVACHGNRIEGNRIEGDFRYGVYLAVASADTQVLRNEAVLEPKAGLADDFQAGFVLENDWPPRPLPADARFSRVNWAAIQGKPWAYADTFGNVFEHNLARGCACGYYAAQFGRAFALRDNRWSRNAAESCRCPFYLFGETPGLFTGNRLEGLRVTGCPDPIRLPPWPQSPFLP
jgi:parallel beta-helix repeat protein